MDLVGIAALVGAPIVVGTFVWQVARDRSPIRRLKDYAQIIGDDSGRPADKLLIAARDEVAARVAIQVLVPRATTVTQISVGLEILGSLLVLLTVIDTVMGPTGLFRPILVVGVVFIYTGAILQSFSSILRDIRIGQLRELFGMPESPLDPASHWIRDRVSNSPFLLGLVRHFFPKGPLATAAAIRNPGDTTSEN